MKISMSGLLKEAQAKHFAVPAMNFIDFTTAKAYLEASQESGLPLILAFAQTHDNWLSLEDAAMIGRSIQESAKTPVVLHLDHGQDFQFIKRAIDLGFNSVMIDASLETFEENVRITKEVVDYAHSKGVDVEAEIGFVGANENLENHQVVESVYTTLEDAQAFYQATQVDSLAISIGTAHGIYKGIPKINFERLAQISGQLPIPLVLHGGSSSGDDNLKRCAREGISKINIFSDVIAAAFAYQEKQQDKDYPSLQEGMKKAMKETLLHYYHVFETKEVTSHEG
ncbi:class II fructose-bisphosphate aldolase [Streptococcus uberis]|uniref:class II fructose-bisphosphate aldolase n=1 Tax=Streptococcus uberis TaxID=1349 RepID=UPI001FF43158|nr:class II fructose-bisphosphate aldolase [Streptococcus uberis]MCK1169594.1 class II fructose-bisphosphate aldolase [Streptococcus uberis]MCK1187859.1 class II fructose-bisphosphate aldolase [Streptococcus uberis]MCK1243182.1 class II fructose-bisphosphate aldolase [Streptococcus uberis]